MTGVNPVEHNKKLQVQKKLWMENVISKAYQFENEPTDIFKENWILTDQYFIIEIDD